MQAKKSASCPSTPNNDPPNAISSQCPCLFGSIEIVDSGSQIHKNQDDDMCIQYVMPMGSMEATSRPNP